MPPDPAVAALAHEARNALTCAQGRLELIRHRVRRADLADAQIADDLETVLGRLRRLGALVNALEAAGAGKR